MPNTPGGGRASGNPGAPDAGAATPDDLAKALPAQPDTRKIVMIGTALWFIAFVVLLPFYDWLGRHGHRIWLWTCLAGWILGLIGLAIMRKHRTEGRTR